MPMPTDHVARISLSEEAYVRIEAAIMDGTLEPGERLRNPDLVEWLGISRTPIRHALDRLAEQGLVEMERNRYTNVARFDIEGVLAAVEVAGDLWAGAALRGIPDWDADADALIAEMEANLVEAAETEDLLTFAAVFEHLVVAFARIEGNEVRLRALTVVIPQVRRVARKLRGSLDPNSLREFTSKLRVATTARDGRAAGLLIEDYVTRLSGMLHRL
ncbi:GntR family transcriptional regulator [Leifsonia xyli subsp. cynodontis DSM 46306]|uniref:HTH gntR-type domain-containing protein n=1 Tax=Leifsonia xyli subsp. cynodontis DSM 46306 TaxID=1389489 RepID=U3P3I6_LEIXC|nr:GntR family transcriptional regulator [Leifsonia xyli]AGW40321.1 GntR family transcriptional regulator [Leifsonia xyli subsp. cynodontis DSM 46306]